MRKQVRIAEGSTLTTRVKEKRISCFLVSLVACLLFVSISTPARADEATVAIAANGWLSGSGVAVCAPGSATHCGGEEHVGGVSSNWWQCVELAQRLYKARGWHGGVFPLAYAYQIYTNASSLGMQAIPSGSVTAIVPGDMIIHDPGQAGADATAGHVAVVDRVDGENIFAVQQNPAGFRTYTLRSDRIVRKDGAQVKGIVHDPDNQLGSGSPNWRQQPDGTWTGSPPDGMIVENVEGGHLYVAAGGVLFWYDRRNGYHGEAFLAQRRRLHGEIPFPRMTAAKVHELEANYPSPRHHVPRDNTYLYEIGNGQQYVMMYSYSFPVGEGDLNYLGGRDKAIAIPPNNLQHFAGTPSIPNDVLLKDHLHPQVYHVVWNTLHHANNDTVVDCVKKIKGGALQPVPVSLLDRLFQAGRYSGSITGCTFPANLAIHGPGGAERWLITGNNPYTRARYADGAVLQCRLGANPTLVEISTNGLNSIPEAAPLACSFEGKQLRSPDGRVWWIKNGIRRQLPNDTIVACLKGRVGTGDVINVSWDTVASHSLGNWAYCPYPLGTNFVKEAADSTVWRVYPDGRREHANGFCVPDPFTTTLYKYRVWVVPNGETHGHSWDGTVFGVTTQSCQALPSP